MAALPETEIEQEEEDVEPEETPNRFANDGSFMEMFRKRLEEQKNASETESKEKPDTNLQNSPTPGTVVATSSASEDVEPEKIYQGGVTGKRKSLLKSAELREKKKKRKEELEEQKQAEEGSEDQSAAWKAYMQEVKAIQARSCTDQDGHKRPLVK